MLFRLSVGQVRQEGGGGADRLRAGHFETEEDASITLSQSLLLAAAPLSGKSLIRLLDGINSNRV